MYQKGGFKLLAKAGPRIAKKLTQVSGSGALKAVYKLDDAAQRGGGAYKAIPTREGYHQHHIPSQWALGESGVNLSIRNAPAVSIEIGDHIFIGSYGRKAGAEQYRNIETELLKQGRFLVAVKMGIEDLRSISGSKYDKEIREMLDYIRTLQ